VIMKFMMGCRWKCITINKVGQMGECGGWVGVGGWDVGWKWKGVHALVQCGNTVIPSYQYMYMYS
jgi:hypothetical protein